MPRYDIKSLLGEAFYNWEKFHQKTKFKKWKPLPEDKKIPESWTKVFFKEYPRLDRFILPVPESLGTSSLEEVLMNRKSTRISSKRPLTLEQISQLLYFSAGLRKTSVSQVGNRTYPSGGARYPLEIYVISQNSDLPKGIYHYNLREHSLEVLLSHSKIDYSFNQPWIKKVPILILITAIFERNTIKYGDRGYRHILQESGHMGQNFYLVSEALNLAVSGIGGYIDDDLHRLLDIDGVKESVVYIIGLGNKKQ